MWDMDCAERAKRGRWMGERGSSAASCSVPLMVTDMERRKPAASKSELILQWSISY